MIKIILSVALLLSTILFPASSAHAQSLTRSDVIQIAPQLASALGQLNNVLGVRQAQFNRQNVALAGIGTTVGQIGVVVGDLDKQSLTAADRAVFDQQVDVLFANFSLLGNYVSRVAQDRTNFNSALDTIGNIMASITAAVASAV